MMQLINSTMAALVSDYLPSDWKRTIIACCLLAYLPVFVFYYSGQMIIDGFNSYQTFYRSVVDFLPYFKSTVVKFIECFQLLVGTFWLMFAIMVLSPLYPFYVAFCAISNTVWGWGVSVYYWKYPKEVTFAIEGQKTSRTEAVTTPRNSAQSYEMTYRGPIVPTMNMD